MISPEGNRKRRRITIGGADFTKYCEFINKTAAGLTNLGLESEIDCKDFEDFLNNDLAIYEDQFSWLRFVFL